MTLVLAEILALAAIGGYQVNAALSNESAALILSAAVGLADADNWEGASYILTADEIDTIGDLVANMLEEVMSVGWEPGNGDDMSYAVIADQKTLGTDGGTFTSGDNRVRDLNTVLSDPDGIVSVADDKFTLQAGTYLILGSAPAFKTQQHQVRLWDDTASEEIAVGSSEIAATAYAAQTRSWVATVETFDVETDIELQHECNTTYADKGFGLAGDFNVEIYSLVIIIKAE